MSTALEQAPEEAVSLFTVQDEKGQVDASVPVRWCISPKTVEMLRKLGARKPKLLLVVEHDGEEMDRYLVPLETEMRFIQFRRPDENVIHATIVWGSGAKSELFNRYDSGEYRLRLLTNTRPGVEALERKDDELETQFWDIDESEETVDELTAIKAQREGIQAEIATLQETEPMQCHMRHEFDETRCIGSTTELGVYVPEELFAGEPPRWMSWLGHHYDGWWHRKPPRDQCDLRRRALITLASLIPVTAVQFVALVFLEAANVFLAGFFLLIGSRNIDFRPLIHPFVYKPKEIGSDLKPSIWFSKEVVKKDDDEQVTDIEYEERHPITLAINPPLMVLFTILGFAAYEIWDSPTFLYFGIAAVFILAIVGTVIALAVAILISDPLVDFVKKYKEKRKKDREERELLKQETLEKNLEQLACSSTSREASLSALPKNRRTAYLRFQDLKTKVCRPFAS